MEQTRYETGIEQLKMIDGIGGENVIRSLENVAPDLGKYIIETFIQCVPYAGFPRVLNAVFTAKKVFAERQIILHNDNLIWRDGIWMEQHCDHRTGR